MYLFSRIGHLKKIILKGRGFRCGSDEKIMRMWFGLEIDVVGLPPLAELPPDPAKCPPEPHDVQKHLQALLNSLCALQDSSFWSMLVIFTFYSHSGFTPTKKSKYISSIFIVKWKYMNYFKESTKFKYYFIQLISTCYTKHEYKHKFK